MSIRESLKRTAELVLPNAVVTRARVRRQRQHRAGHRERIVRHLYGGDEFRVVIGSRYAERYDCDWGEPAEISILKQGRLRPGALVFDLGANCGVLAMMLAAAVRPGGRVIALEAHPDDARLAQRNRDLNALDNLDCLNAAVARTRGTIAFGHNGSVDDGDGRWGRISVDAWSIDDLADRFGTPDVIFIDVEGFEHQALLGAQRTLERQPDWFVEVHSAELPRYGAASSSSVIACFDPARYRILVAVDRLLILPGVGVQSDTRFCPLAQFPPGLLGDRFFLIATAA